MIWLKFVMKWLLGLVFVAAGINHFRQPEFYVRIMPPYLPWPWTLVYISGVFEIALGILVQIPRFTTLAAWGLISLLVAVFPANLHMAIHPEQFPEFEPSSMWLRLPLQGVLIAWVYWCTRSRS